MEEVKKGKTPGGITLTPVIYGRDIDKYLRSEESQRYWRLEHLIAEEKEEELDFKKLRELEAQSNLEIYVFFIHHSPRPPTL